ncbi:sigma-70 family RNA polymerase sigma factor [Sorangium sp. So ce726]|uniref:sigma-70 family RNA polymerase sigma factor n=1 Tax=Sorangium sp. So ce726 TaxID=3133319 RepID=UPI003F611EF0
MTRKEAVAERRRTSRRVEMGAPPAVHVPFEANMRHSRMIHAVLRQFAVPARDQPDLMQEIFLSAWRSVEGGGFLPRPEVPPKQALQSWLFAVTWHHIFHYRERLYRWYRELAAFAAPGIARHAPPPFGQVDKRMALRCLERLKPERRAVLAGTAVGNTAEEIAAELGAHPGDEQTAAPRAKAVAEEPPLKEVRT